MATRYFHPADYCVLVAVLGVSSLIGVYFAWKDRRSTNKKDFFGGSRQLQMFPVTMSMTASNMSAIAILGVPAENFLYGSQYMVVFVGVVIASLLAAHVFVPVFYNMDMISVNQYLENRFNSPLIRKIISALTVIEMCFFMGVVLYGPSLALGSVTGLPVWLSILVNGSVCAFYTAVGFMTIGEPSEVFDAVNKEGLLEFFEALYINMLGVSLVLTISSICGLLLFALYHRCDPVKASVIAKYDQLMPYFVMETLGHRPGITGLFVTAVYSGSLSTLSSGYNALAAIIWEDFIKHMVKLSPTGAMWATKAIAAGFGVIAVALAFLSGSLPSILTAAFVLTGSIKGATAAIFILGLLLPWCGSTIAMSSMFTGLGLAFWVAVGRLLYPAKPTGARTTLEECTLNYTAIVPAQRSYYSGGIYDLYNVSYMWIPVISFVVTLLVAIALTVIFCFKKTADVDPSLIAPCMRKIYLKTRTSGKQESAKEQKPVPMKTEEKSDGKQVEFSFISGSGNGYVNHVMTNDNGVERTDI
ncbi:sodium-coupled monocarboxylate transporter 1 isoform X4 [Rhipicephalus sanguineus]|uniref:sodium-coupled monocarboxylate transporter 1 isoform X4 n=1 Tax=Rhipicephalus sanguineus TaxID=34632 RepID=UPI001893501C|nr:sodium-coupled monocarboxylate transporter 1 isoform X4 [Rhipicephalus sanguineus]